MVEVLVFSQAEEVELVCIMDKRLPEKESMA